MNLPPSASRRVPTLFSVCEEISNRPDCRGDRFGLDLPEWRQIRRADYGAPGAQGDLLFLQAVLLAREAQQITPDGTNQEPGSAAGATGKRKEARSAAGATGKEKQEATRAEGPSGK